MKNNNFVFDNLKLEKKGEKLVIRGTAAVSNKVHAHGHTENYSKSLKSYFTDKAIEKMAKDIKYKPIFVDALHNVSTNLNVVKSVEKLMADNPELKDELFNIKENLKVSEVPMFKVSEFNVDDGQLIVELESNPLYKEVDDKHKKYYEVITGSIQDGFINGLSTNFVVNDVKEENGISKINDLDLFGLSLVDGPAMGSCTAISELATRSIKGYLEIRKGEEKMTEENVNVKVADKQQPDVESLVSKKVEEALKQRELEVQKQRQEEEYSRMKSELESLKKEKVNVGSKGVPPVENKPTFTPEQIKEKINNLSESDLIRVWAEFGLNNNTQNSTPMIKTASHHGRENDPRVQWKWESPSSSMAEIQRSILRQSNVDMRFR